MKLILVQFLAACALSACATRSLPASYPADSPVSLESASAPQANVVRALTGDPPLPGQSMEGWPGLDTTPPPATTPQAGALYACPMHPEVTADHASRCPRCGMQLEHK